MQELHRPRTFGTRDRLRRPCAKNKEVWPNVSLTRLLHRSDEPTGVGRGDGRAVRLATKTSAPAGQAGGGRFDDLSCRGSIRSLWPSVKLPLRPHGCPCLTRGQP